MKNWLVGALLGLGVAILALVGAPAAQAAATNVYGLDPANGNAICLVAAAGSSPTCILPTTGGGTGGGGAAIPGNFTPNQVTCGTAATLIVASRSGRQLLSIVNTTATPIYVGGSAAVTVLTGQLLPGIIGASMTVPYSGALYCIVASAPSAVTEAEIY
ncbi:MAG TPA: hypothetical protein VGF33_10005 [Caulobacteraceae bacterium]|jgi:hypothetical protein